MDQQVTSGDDRAALGATVSEDISEEWPKWGQGGTEVCKKSKCPGSMRGSHEGEIHKCHCCKARRSSSPHLVSSLKLVPC